MTKSDFLTQISNMSRDDIDEYFKKSIIRTKLIYPVVIIRPSLQDENNGNNKNIIDGKKGEDST